MKIDEESTFEQKDINNDIHYVQVSRKRSNASCNR